jgi:hypothetical protein
VLGDQEIGEPRHPRPQRFVRCLAGGCGTSGRGERVELVPEDRDHQVGPGREVPVDGAHADTRLGGDVPHGSVDPRTHEHGGGGVQERLLVAPGIESLTPANAGGRRRTGRRHSRRLLCACQAEQRSI